MSLLDPRVADHDAYLERMTDVYMRGDGAVYAGIRWAVDSDGEVDLDRCEYADALEAERWIGDGENWATRSAFYRLQDREPADDARVPALIAALVYAMAQIDIDARIVEEGAL